MYKGTVNIIGIAGGSGSGKSTLAVALCKKYPDQCGLLHVDDYFKKKEDVRLINNYTNWDHPTAIRFDDLYTDLKNLKQKKAVRVFTKSELYNPSYDHALKNKLEYLIEPKPLIILEGYLALYEQRIRDLMALKIYLDIAIEHSASRRSLNKFVLDPEYFKQVLAPMHAEFVETSKEFADSVIDVSSSLPEEVLETVEKIIFEKFPNLLTH